MEKKERRWRKSGKVRLKEGQIKRRQIEDMVPQKEETC